MWTAELTLAVGSRQTVSIHCGRFLPSSYRMALLVAAMLALPRLRTQRLAGPKEIRIHF